MKPEDLKSPFTWKERKITFDDRVLYVPPMYNKETVDPNFKGWPALFERDAPLKVEYCSGNGAWIADRAERDIDSSWIAIERKFVRVRKIWSKIKNLGLTNLIAVCGEGMRVTTEFFPHESVDEVFVNFPDPWPKKRHYKNRIIQASFVAELCRILKTGGVVNLVTDDQDYSNWMIAVMNGHTGFKSEHPAPFYLNEYPGYGTSWFEDLWTSQGKQIFYHQFRKMA